MSILKNALATVSNEDDVVELPSLEDYENTKLGFEIDKDFKELETVVKYIPEITSAKTDAVGLESVKNTIIAKECGVDTISSEVDMKKLIASITRFIKKIISKVWKFIKFVFGKIFMGTARLLTFNTILKHFGKTKAKNDLLEYMLKDGVNLEEVLKIAKEAKQIERMPVIELSQSSIDATKAFITLSGFWSSEFKTLSGQPALIDSMLDLMVKGIPLDLSALDNSSKSFLTKLGFENNNAIIGYKELTFEDNGTYVTKLNFTDTIEKKIPYKPKFDTFDIAMNVVGETMKIISNQRIWTSLPSEPALDKALDTIKISDDEALNAAAVRDLFSVTAKTIKTYADSFSVFNTLIGKMNIPMIAIVTLAEDGYVVKDGQIVKK